MTPENENVVSETKRLVDELDAPGPGVAEAARRAEEQARAEGTIGNQESE